MHIGCYVLQISCKSIQVVRVVRVVRVVISECCLNSAKHGKRTWFSKYLENNNIKKMLSV